MTHSPDPYDDRHSGTVPQRPREDTFRLPSARPALHRLLDVLEQV